MLKPVKDRKRKLLIYDQLNGLLLNRWQEFDGFAWVLNDVARSHNCLLGLMNIAVIINRRRLVRIFLLKMFGTSFQVDF